MEPAPRLRRRDRGDLARYRAASMVPGCRRGLNARRWRLGGRLQARPDPRTAWGRTPVFVYGFDDFTELQLRALETSPTVDADVRSRCRSSLAALAFRLGSRLHERADAPGGEEWSWPARRPPGRRARRSITSSGSCSRTAPRTVSRPAGGPAPLGRRRARRGGAGAAPCSTSCAPAHAPGDVAVVFRDPLATRRSWSRCSAPTASRLARSLAPVRPHRPRPRAAGADPRRRTGRDGGRPPHLPRTPGLRGPLAFAEASRRRSAERAAPAAERARPSGSASTGN